MFGDRVGDVTDTAICTAACRHRGGSLSVEVPVEELTESYAETTANPRPAVERDHAVVRAEVSAASVADATAGRVNVLLYVNQYRWRVNITGEKVDQNRVVLTLVPIDGQWKVAHAETI